MKKHVEFTLNLDDNGGYSVTNYKETDVSQLTIILKRPYANDLGDGILERITAVRSVFESKFGQELKSGATTMQSTHSDWYLVIHKVRQEHIQWAKDAKACGLIDDFEW